MPGKRKAAMGMETLINHRDTALRAGYQRSGILLRPGGGGGRGAIYDIYHNHPFINSFVISSKSIISG